MQPDEFNSIPKDKIIVIADIDKFNQFIIFNAVRKSVFKISKCFVSPKSLISGQMVDKYIVKSTKDIKDYVAIELKRYVQHVKKEDMEESEYGLEEDEIEEIAEQMMNSMHSIKRGDVDRIVLSTTNEIIYKALNVMSGDKLVKLCWDSENDEFVWLPRKPGELDKVETSPKNKRTRKKKE